MGQGVEDMKIRYRPVYGPWWSGTHTDSEWVDYDQIIPRDAHSEVGPQWVGDSSHGTHYSLGGEHLGFIRDGGWRLSEEF